MDCLEAINHRCSTREFEPTAELDPTILEKLLHAGIAAPSAGNCQPWHFFVVTSPEVKRALAEAAYNQTFLCDAAVVLAVCAVPTRSARRYGRRGETLYCIQDTAAAIENILLAATALDLATCWIGAFDDVRVAQALHLPEDLRPVALIPVGKPLRRPQRQTTRRPLHDVVTWLS